VKLRHLTSSVQQSLQDLLVETVQIWQRDWCMSPQPAHVTVSSCGSPDESYVYLFDGQDSGNFLAVDEVLLDRKRLLFGDHAQHAPDDRVCEALLVEAVDQLYSAVYRCVTGAEGDVQLRAVSRGDRCPEPPVSVHYIGDVFLSLDVRIGTQTVLVVVPFHAVECEPSPTASPAPKPTKIKPNDLRISIEAEIRIGFGRHSVADIAGLDVGDVLLSATPIDQLFAISVDNTFIANARLGRSGQKKAVTLVKPGT
jgi:hypothetical protein